MLCPTENASGCKVGFHALCVCSCSHISLLSQKWFMCPFSLQAIACPTQIPALQRGGSWSSGLVYFRAKVWCGWWSPAVLLSSMPLSLLGYQGDFTVQLSQELNGIYVLFVKYLPSLPCSCFPVWSVFFFLPKPEWCDTVGEGKRRQLASLGPVQRRLKGGLMVPHSPPWCPAAPHGPTASHRVWVFLTEVFF